MSPPPPPDTGGLLHKHHPVFTAKLQTFPHLPTTTPRFLSKLRRLRFVTLCAPVLSQKLDLPQLSLKFQALPSKYSAP